MKRILPPGKGQKDHYAGLVASKRAAESGCSKIAILVAGAIAEWGPTCWVTTRKLSQILAYSVRHVLRGQLELQGAGLLTRSRLRPGTVPPGGSRPLMLGGVVRRTVGWAKPRDVAIKIIQSVRAGLLALGSLNMPKARKPRESRRSITDLIRASLGLDREPT
jgi:hypothetical protein